MHGTFDYFPYSPVGPVIGTLSLLCPSSSVLMFGVLNVCPLVRDSVPLVVVGALIISPQRKARACALFWAQTEPSLWQASISLSFPIQTRLKRRYVPTREVENPYLDKIITIINLCMAGSADTLCTCTSRLLLGNIIVIKSLYCRCRLFSVAAYRPVRKKSGTYQQNKQHCGRSL